MTIDTNTTPDYKAQFDQVSDRLLEAQRQIRSLQSDIDTIGGSLIEEADNRGWCSEYDEFVGNLNNVLSYPLPVRQQQYVREITLTINYTAHPDDEDDALAEIARAIYNHGDNLNGLEYTIDSWE